MEDFHDTSFTSPTASSQFPAKHIGLWTLRAPVGLSGHREQVSLLITAQTHPFRCTTKIQGFSVIRDIEHKIQQKSSLGATHADRLDEGRCVCVQDVPIAWARNGKALPGMWKGSCGGRSAQCVLYHGLWIRLHKDSITKTTDQSK